MKYRSKIIFFLTLAATLGLSIAEVVDIDPKRIDVMVNQYKKEMEVNGTKIAPEEEASIRKNIKLQLQQFDVLKNEAFMVKLDQEPQVKILLENMQSMFYAQQYVNYLKENMTVNESDLHLYYERLSRNVRLQQASFESKEAADQALVKLRKGLSFTDLTKTLPNQLTISNDFINPNDLPAPVAAVVNGLDKGQITDKPFEFQGIYYLFKIVGTEKRHDMPAYEAIKGQLIEQKKAELVQEKIAEIMKKYGLNMSN